MYAFTDSGERARIAGWQSTPYYIKDNPQYFDRALNPGRYAAVPLALAEDLYMRLSDMRMYGFNHQGSAKFNNALDEALKAQLAGDQKAFDDAMKTMEFTRKTNERAQEYAALKKAKEDLYLVLNAHPDYKDVKYDSKTGGIKATHKDHTFDPDKGQYERNARDAGYASGHVVILTSEKFGQTGQKFTEGKWDGLEFEIMGCETATPNNLVAGLKHSSSKKTTKIAVLEFPNGGFDADEMDRAIKRYAGIVKQKPENFIEFERVICTQNGKVVYDRPYKTVREAPVSRSTPRTANIEDITRMTKKLAAEINLDTSNLSVLKSRAAKKPIDPAQERHKYDAQIEELRKNAERYHLNMDKIMEAYVAMDLKKIEAAIREQQKIFEAGYAKKGKIYEAADKRHASRTPEKEKTLKDFMAQHKEKTLKSYRQADDAIAEAKGIKEADVSVLRNLRTGKSGTINTKAGKTVTASLEKMHKESMKLQQIAKEFKALKDEATALIDAYKDSLTIDNAAFLKVDSIKGMKEFINRIKEDAKNISKLNTVLDNCEKYKIVKLDVNRLPKALSSEEIVDRLAGGDLTSGSCSSLAFAYAGNRAGLDVLDFRGGGSCSFFSRTTNIIDVTKAVGGVVARHTNDFKKAKDLLDTVVDGKEYYFTCGAHAAIVRMAKGGGYEYLEMQSRYKERNGWHPLDDGVLKSRFGAKKKHSSYGYVMETRDVIIEVSLLAKDSKFKDMLSYINTRSAEQKKGAAGNIK